jgi:hypothetical protein
VARTWRSTASTSPIRRRRRPRRSGRCRPTSTHVGTNTRRHSTREPTRDRRHGPRRDPHRGTLPGRCRRRSPHHGRGSPRTTARALGHTTGSMRCSPTHPLASPSPSRCGWRPRVGPVTCRAGSVGRRTPLSSTSAGAAGHLSAGPPRRSTTPPPRRGGRGGPGCDARRAPGHGAPAPVPPCGRVGRSRAAASPCARWRSAREE